MVCLDEAGALIKPSGMRLKLQVPTWDVSVILSRSATRTEISQCPSWRPAPKRCMPLIKITLSYSFVGVGTYPKRKSS